MYQDLQISKVDIDSDNEKKEKKKYRTKNLFEKEVNYLGIMYISPKTGKWNQAKHFQQGTL